MYCTFDSLVNIRLINKETWKYHRLRKMSFWEIFDFQCIYVDKLRCRPSLKSLETFIMIRHYIDLTLCRCTYSSQSNTNTFHCSAWAFTISIPPVKEKKHKLTWTTLYSNKALMNFQQGAWNGHVPAINLLQFFVHSLSITSYHSR